MVVSISFQCVCEVSSDLFFSQALSTGPQMPRLVQLTGQQTRGVVVAGAPTLRMLSGNLMAAVVQARRSPVFYPTTCLLHWQYEYKYTCSTK